MADENERILNEATDWLLILAEAHHDDPARAEFQQWLSIDSRHEAAWSELNHTYHLIGEADPVLPGRWKTGESQKPVVGWLSRANRHHDTGQSHPRFHKRYALSLAASIILVIWFAPAAMIALNADHSTGTGQIRTIRLEDGSSARLGPSSAIRVSYAGAERRVELLAGEALFQVRPDKTRPFRVLAGDLTATVLGTGFDVRLKPSGTEVGVQHGKVRVDLADTAKEPFILKAGDRLLANPHGETQTDHVAPQLIASWALGEVNARDRTVTEVIDDIRPWYRGRILLVDDDLAIRRVNGVYNPRDASQAIRSLVLPLGGSVTQITPWLIVVRGN